MPAGPPPTMPMCWGRSIDGGAATFFHVSWSPDSGPYCSVTKRLSARMAMGLSISPRRHASSQGAAHTRPQTEANGFGSLAVRYASSSLPSAMAATYMPALVCTGQAARHGMFSSKNSSPLNVRSSSLCGRTRDPIGLGSVPHPTELHRLDPERIDRAWRLWSS